MEFTDVFFLNTAAIKKSDLIINQGGARAGKTFAIMQILLLYALYSKDKIVISVVSQSIPHLKKGVIRDFKNICYGENINFDKHFNKSELIFEHNGNIIEFFSSDNTGKVRGPARNILFINEADKIKYEVYEQLEIRTTDKIIIDFNPVTKFWVHYEIIDKNIPHEFIHTTYKNNSLLSNRIIKAIERKKDNENWWRVYGLGLIGFSEEIIFNESKIKRFDTIPETKDKISVSYTDIAYGGGDYFCSVFAYIIENKVYIHDVIFNKKTIDINEKVLIDKLIKYDVKYYGIETNGGGVSVGLRIYNEVKQTYIPVVNKASKITRIITNASTIIDNFYFKNDLSSDYYSFFNQFTSFNTDESKNKNDDAPDAVAGLAKFISQTLGFLKF